MRPRAFMRRPSPQPRRLRPANVRATGARWLAGPLGPLARWRTAARERALARHRGIARRARPTGRLPVPRARVRTGPRVPVRRSRPVLPTRATRVEGRRVEPSRSSRRVRRAQLRRGGNRAAGPFKLNPDAAPWFPKATFKLMKKKEHLDEQILIRGVGLNARGKLDSVTRETASQLNIPHHCEA